MRLTRGLAIEETAPKRTYQLRLVAFCEGSIRACVGSVFGLADIPVCCREACAQLYRLHMGPQVVGCLLGGHESVCHHLGDVDCGGSAGDWG